MNTGYLLSFEDRVKSKIGNFTEDHPYFTMKISLVVSIWIMFCICAITMAGIAGVSAMTDSIDKGYLDDEVSVTEYSNWHSIVVPIFNGVIFTMSVLAITIIVISLYVCAYNPLKWSNI